MEALQRDGFLKQDGRLDADMQNVLLSAYQETTEGPVIVNPFQLTSPQDAAELSRSESKGIDRLLRRLRQQGGDEKDRPPGREV